MDPQQTKEQARAVVEKAIRDREQAKLAREKAQEIENSMPSFWALLRQKPRSQSMTCKNS